jgi:hypothetical protein
MHSTKHGRALTTATNGYPRARPSTVMVVMCGRRGPIASHARESVLSIAFVSGAANALFLSPRPSGCRFHRLQGSEARAPSHDRKGKSRRLAINRDHRGDRPSRAWRYLKNSPALTKRSMDHCPKHLPNRVSRRDDRGGAVCLGMFSTRSFSRILLVACPRYIVADPRQKRNLRGPVLPPAMNLRTSASRSDSPHFANRPLRRDLDVSMFSKPRPAVRRLASPPPYL